MLKILPFVFVFFAIEHCALAQTSLIGPLLPVSTEVDLSTSIITKVKGTPCFTTIAAVTECRRKRGIEENAIIIQLDQSDMIDPSNVLAVEITRAPRSFYLEDSPKSNPQQTIVSSMDEAYNNSYKFFGQLLAFAGRQGNVININSEGCSGAIGFSKFLSCIGLNVQNTDTETSWFTTTTTITSGFSAIFVAGCTPPFFPYPLCTF